jgi:hypothetical protein
MSVGGVPRLSRAQFFSILVIALAIFAVGCGPIWRHPFDIDAAVFASYVPIPVLVAACLAWSKKLRLSSFFLDTVEIAALKFGLTYGVAILLWALSGAPAPPAPAASADEAAEISPPAHETAPAPTPVAPETTGALSGVVAGDDGKPVAGALVWVRSGLEAFTFAPPAEPVALENDGSGFAPPVAVVQTWQPLLVRSTNSKLHTIYAVAEDGSSVFSFPVLASGDPRRIVLRRAHGVVSLGCKVHALDGHEPRSTLAILSHPFWAITGPNGRFAWRGVPAGRLRVAARRGAEEVGADVSLEAGGSPELHLAFGPAR